MTDLLPERDTINFGDLPEEIDALLQQGVAVYRHDHAKADGLFRQALAAAPAELPIYFCLYKIHTYQGHLDEPQLAVPDGPGRFALYTLKALAFIHLRRDEQHQANQMLAALRRLDPTGAVGWPVVAALAEGVS